ncbi:MAG: MgtC/SapB family protein [Pseudomonadota bacterium]|nr:MgtC/SapB family protein [Pseudomonadota bacterium]
MQEHIITILSGILAANEFVINVAVSIMAGGMIGLERSYHGRPAGFRTHALVCLGSSMLMLVTVYQEQWFSGAVLETVRVDPTRMAQGVMTGIGFLGAGVIIKEGASIRGLTTAASIWVTAALGIVAGVGLYALVAIGTFITILTLSLFRWVETHLPVLTYASHSLTCAKAAMIQEDELVAVIRKHKIGITGMSYSAVSGGGFEYSMTLSARDARNFRALSRTLLEMDGVLGFKITPKGF